MVGELVERRQSNATKRIFAPNPYLSWVADLSYKYNFP